MAKHTPRLLLWTMPAFLFGSSSHMRAEQVPAAPDDRPPLQAGYLPAASLPDSLGLLPPPPAAGSAALARDEEVARSLARMAGSPEWNSAADNSKLNPELPRAFACAMAMDINPQGTPTLYRLLQRSLIDLGTSVYRAKNQYQRQRPFAVQKRASCTPDADDVLSKDGSYPSGYAAIVWGWSLILSEVNPDRTDAVLKRGRDLGQSRLVCNVHWQSDVDAGRAMASATVARLHADSAFAADVKAAREEVAAARLSRSRPTRDCAAEAALSYSRF